MEEKKKPPSGSVILHYEAGVKRKKPPVYRSEVIFRFAYGVPALLCLFGFGYMWVHDLFHNTTKGLGEVCGSLLLLLFILSTCLVIIYMLAEGLQIHNRNQKWMRHTAKTKAKIIDRQEGKYITALDYNYDTYTPIYELIIQVDDQPGAPEINDRTIRAEVDQSIFKRYAKKDHLVIYYDTEDPLSFILRGE